MERFCILVLICGSILLAPAEANRKTPNCAAGRDGQVLVHLFSWKWSDIANECENVLGPKGFCGVQVSPPNEHRIVTTPDRPWWERYQPVSYKLESASGSRSEFIDMVQRCKAAGIQVYIDAVINHMTGIDAGRGVGTGGSSYNTQELKFSGVPYGPDDFNKRCTTGSGNIENYGDADQVRNCRLLGLLDLDGENGHVRRKIADYFDDMLDIGIDGYRIDAAKHMLPVDIEAILSMTRQTTAGTAAFVYQEIIENGNEPVQAADYKHLGRLLEFKYGVRLLDIFKWHHTSMSNLNNFGGDPIWAASSDAVAFVDNHDNQRGHGSGGGVLTYKNGDEYKMAVIFMLSWPYGVPRVMSSYEFTMDWTGPPPGSPGQSVECDNNWICEHRWKGISDMVQWRNSAGSSGVDNWWTNGNNQIAFSRGSSSFIAFNKRDGNMNTNLKTGLPSGTYCDVISGNLENGRCTGMMVTVSSDTTANIQIDGSAEVPVIAIHTGSKIGSSSNVPPTIGVTNPQSTPETSSAGSTLSQGSTTSPQGTIVPSPSGAQRTIVFIRKMTDVGQNVFLRGGCGSDCSIPITYPTPRTGDAFQSYNKWAQGDTLLDWKLVPESGQSQGAQGSPMAWTSNSTSHDNYVPENSYGDHYWMWDVMMDCSKTKGGYFEVKGYLDGQWESNILQTPCSGQPTPAFQSINHVARCGYKNVFTWDTNVCTMERLPQP